MPEDFAAVLDKVNWERFQHQRAALLAVIDRDESDTLEGLLNLTDHLIDAAEAQGLLSAGEARTWWAEGCIAAGLGDPREDEDDLEGDV